MERLVAPNPVFLANMTQLWRHDARLAQQIDELPPEATIDVQPSKKGPPTASVTTADGRRLFLHSRYDPEQEARDFCASLEKTEAFCIFLSGLGLGYHVKTIFETFGEETVVVVSEPDLVTIKTALERVDLSEELGLGRVEILCTLDKDVVHQRLGRHSMMLMLGTLFAAPPVSRDHHADFHAACRKVVLDYAAFAKMSLLTLVRNAGITCRNIANNLPTYVCTPPPDMLRRCFRACPAILVAAGPSLSKNLDGLAALQDRAVIIAAQTTLRLLLDRGVKPHFVTSLDYSEMSRQFFENVDIPEDVVLVAEPKATWHVVDAFRGTPKMAGRRVVLLDNPFAHQCIGDALAKRSPMEAGATVMHLAFYLAQWLGCDPIIFVGQDLAFGGHCYYAPGVAMHRAWRPETGRFCTLEMKEWERIARHRHILRKVRDPAGREIYTDEQMFTYLQQFERDFALSGATVIDATEGGALKAGTTVMSLAEAAERFCRAPIDAARFGYLGRPWYDRSKLAPARAELVQRREELRTFQSLCEETRDVLSEMEKLVDQPAEFNRRVVRVDELRTLVQHHAVIFRMVRDVSQLGELQRFAADRRLAMDGGLARDEAHDAKRDVTRDTKREATRDPKREAARSKPGLAEPVRARRQLQRDRSLVDALLDGCEFLARTLDETLARFDDAMKAAP